MIGAPFYSDRTTGQNLRETEEITEPAWRGVLALVNNKINSNFLAQQFPDPCPDGAGVVGTQTTNLVGMMEALIPGFEWPPQPYGVPKTHVALDLIDFVAQRVAKPRPGHYHTFYGHFELNSDVQAGRAVFSKEVNLLFARNGIAFELGQDMRVVRLGPPESRQVLADLHPDTGDKTLDQLISDSRKRYLSRNPDDKRIGLEKLWDAFERLKTIEPGNDKRAKVAALLDRVASGAMRVNLENEAIQLTNIGNEMQIRHFEHNKAALNSREIDYLFIRMAAFIVHSLRETERLDIRGY
jgi:hypothetical protein